MSPSNSRGSYLIRESESTPGEYALSVRDWDRVQHYKIHQSHDQEFYISECSLFKSLQDLVAHYEHNAGGLHINLRKPCVIIPTDVSGNPVEWSSI